MSASIYLCPIHLAGIYVGAKLPRIKLSGLVTEISIAIFFNEKKLKAAVS